jgi:hypothetical protein
MRNQIWSRSEGPWSAEQKGWAQVRLAEEAHLHRTYPAGIETAKPNQSLRNLIRIPRLAIEVK